MALSTTTNAAFPTNTPGTLRKAVGSPLPVADGVFVYADGADRWERVFDSGQKTYYASWLKTTSAPADLTALINVALADARVQAFIVDADITINGTVNANGKVFEFISGVASGTGSITNADFRSRYTFSPLSGVSLASCVFSSYTPQLGSDSEANGKNIVYYYNVFTNKHRIKNGSVWYDIPVSILQNTTQSVSGDGSVGSPIKLTNDEASPVSNSYYGTNSGGTRGFHPLPSTTNSVTTGDSVQGTGLVASPVKLVGDSATPGNSKYYGTDGAGAKGFYTLPVQSVTNSIVGDGTSGNPLKLSGDTASPGNNKVYRTDGSGVRSWGDFPAASSTINSTDSVTGDGSIGTPVKLVNDSASPGQRKYYGTGGGGTKGYFDVDVVVTNSIDGSGTNGTPLKLVNDAASPGNSQYYGTNSGGTKGFYSLPTTATTNSITGTGVTGSEVKLVNDTASPGNNKVYGTDGSGVRAWRDFPVNSSTINSTNSVTGDGSGGDPVKLVNDSASPGNSRYYGTDSGGSKGYHALPAATVTTGNSVTGNGSGSTIQLVNDAASPGNTKYYGTDGSGTKGFFTLPTTTNTVTSADSVTGDGSGGSPVRLSGDSAAPGASRYYGTNGAGTKGFHVLPTVDGSETKINSGTNTTVSGSGTTGSPYTVNATMVTGSSITGNGTSGTPATLVNDNASPGALRYYGTDGGGTKGFHVVPTYDGSETKVTAGTNVTVTGAGTVASPYVVNATAASPAHASKGQLTAAVNFSFATVKGVGGSWELSNNALKTGSPTDDNLRHISIVAMVYADATSFSTGSFINVATIPSGFRPTGLVSFSIPTIIPGTANPATTPIRASDYATGIINGAVYGSTGGYIDADTGNVFVRVNSVSTYATLSGTTVMVIPIVVTYFRNPGT